jgi:hypothetical protein
LTAKDIGRPLERKLDYVRLARKNQTLSGMDQKSGDDLGIHHISQKILIMSIPMPLGHVFHVARIVGPKRDSRPGLEPPQPTHQMGCMLLVIPNGMSNIRRINKLADSPSVPPMNPAVGIAHHHQVDTRLMNGKESMDHIDRPWDSGGDQNDSGTGRQTSHHGLCHIGSIVDIDLPLGEISTGQVDILKHPRIIPGIFGTIEAEREHSHHYCYVDRTL